MNRNAATALEARIKAGLLDLLDRASPVRIVDIFSSERSIDSLPNEPSYQN
jgi:hypothetical protein